MDADTQGGCNPDTADIADMSWDIRSRVRTGQPPTDRLMHVGEKVRQQRDAKMPKAELPSCCGSDCGWADTEGEPCWGEIDVIEEVFDGVWVHACTGHHDVYDGGVYKPKPHHATDSTSPTPAAPPKP